MLGRTPCHYAVHCHVPNRDLPVGGRSHAEDCVRVPVRVAKEAFHPGDGGRDNRKAIRPDSIPEMVEHLIKMPDEDNIPWRRFGLGGSNVAVIDGDEPFENRRKDKLAHSLRKDIVWICRNHTRIDGQRQVLDTERLTQDLRHPEECLRDNRNAWDARSFNRSVRPQHGGRTAPSSPYTDHDSINPMLSETLRQESNCFRLFPWVPMNVSEGCVSNECFGGAGPLGLER